MIKGYEFRCLKCGHKIFTDKLLNAMHTLNEVDCPNCGEEGLENWIVLGDVE